MRIKKIYFNRMYDQWRGEPLYVEDGLDDDKLYIRIMDVPDYKEGAINTITADYKDLNGGTYTILGQMDFDKRLAIFKIPLSILSNSGIYEVVFSLSFNAKDKEGLLLKTPIQTFEIVDTIESDDEAIAQDPNYPILVDLINQLAEYKVDTSIFPTREEMMKTIEENLNKTSMEEILKEVQANGYITLDKLNTILRNYASKADLSGYAKESDLNKFVTNLKFIQELDKYVLKTSMGNYVLKETGKGLSTHDLTDELYEKLINLDINNGEVDIDLSDYQTRIDNTLTTTDKTIVGSINEIKNSIPTKTSQLQNDSGYLTEHQDLSDYATKSELHNHDNKNILDTITQEKMDSWDNKSEFSGSYNDLTDKPIIPTIPDIPTKVSQLENDSNYATESFVTDKIIEADLGGNIDLSEYAKTSDIPTKVSQLENDSKYINRTYAENLISTDVRNFLLENTFIDCLNKIVSSFISDTIVFGNYVKYFYILRGRIRNISDNVDLPITINNKEYNNVSYISMINTEYNILTTFIFSDEGTLRIETPYTPILDDVDVYIGMTITEIGKIYELKGSSNGEITECHTHTNKDILDTITSTMINNWNNKSDVTINDDINNISTTQTYSNSMIENRLTEVGADITVISDDLDSIDARVTYLEDEQTKMGSFDGSYDSLTNKPTIPTKTSELTNDSGFTTKKYVDDKTEILPIANKYIIFEDAVPHFQEEVYIFDNLQNEEMIPGSVDGELTISFNDGTEDITKTTTFRNYDDNYTDSVDYLDNFEIHLSYSENTNSFTASVIKLVSNENGEQEHIPCTVTKGTFVCNAYSNLIENYLISNIMYEQILNIPTELQYLTDGRNETLRSKEYYNLYDNSFVWDMNKINERLDENSGVTQNTFSTTYNGKVIKVNQKDSEGIGFGQLVPIKRDKNVAIFVRAEKDVIIKVYNPNTKELIFTMEDIYINSFRYAKYYIPFHKVSDIDNIFIAFTIKDIPTDSFSNNTIYDLRVIDESTFLKKEEVLTKANTKEYIPTGDYNPATKKYVDNNIPHYNETLMFEISGEDYNSLMNNSYFNMSALNIDETKSYIGKINIDIEYTFKFVYNKEADALMDEVNQMYIYNHKSYNGTNFIEDENSAVITNMNATFGVGGVTFDGCFRLYEIDKVELNTNCLPNDVNIPNSLTVGVRKGNIGEYSVAEGNEVIASGEGSHAEGEGTEATGNISHAEGAYTIASGNISHAEGGYTTASGDYSHAEGDNTTASGESSHAEGESSNSINYVISNFSPSISNDDILTAWNTNKFSLAKGVSSHVEGKDSLALGESSHAEGYSTTASGDYSHAEGIGSTASGVDSHAEGIGSTASGMGSHAEGDNTTASGDFSHAEGDRTIATSDHQHVQGKHNIEDTENKYAHIVGNGEADTARSNAHTLDWNGNAWYAGKLSQEGTPTEDKDLTTKKYVDDNKFSKNYEDLNNEPFTFLPIKLTETIGSNGTITAYCDVFDLELGHRYVGDFTKYDGICLYTFNSDNTKNTLVATTAYLSTGRNGMITIMSSSATKREILWMSAFGSERITVTKNSDGTFTIANSLIVPRVTNTREFTPTSNYHLVHKKYVDDKVAGVNASTITGLSTVATSGDYNDLTNKPTIPSEYTLPTASATQLGGVKIGAGLSINDGVLSANGGGTADSVDWSNVQNKPTIPSKVSQLTNDSGFITSIPSEYITETELEAKGYLTEHQNISGKVDKVDGKGLSTNDLTNTLKANYDTAYTHSQSTHAPSNAQKNSDITKAEIETKLIGDISTHTHSQYLTSIPNEYITETELNAKGYLTEHQSLDGLATETYVNTKVSELVDSAPETLDTLKELSTALGDDPNFATTVSNQIGNKVDKVDGKSLVLDTEIAKIHSHDNKTILDGITSTNISNWNSAYTHSTSAHAPSNAQKNSDITKTEIEAKLIGDIATHTHSQYLTSIPSEYITETELNAKGYATEDYVTETVNNASMSGGYTHPETHPASMITGLSTVATSGSYNDLTNKPTIPSIEGLATETYVNNKVAGLVDSAPESLNTLNELATALGNDANFATTVSNQIGSKVDKVEGKSLVLDTEIAKIHEHSNKDLLDTIGSDNVHAHSNKSVIDTITSDMTTKWNKSIPFENTYVSDCDTWLTNGYTKTSTSTAHHPSVCTGADRWGVLFYISENAQNGTGTQMYFPIDGTYAGRIFTRKIVNRSAGAWNLVSTFNGSYNDLTDKPTIPSEYTLPTASADTLGGIKVGAGLSITADGILSATGGGTADSVNWENVVGKPTFATVATSGSYNDLTDKPTIPTAYTHPDTHPASMITGLSTVATSGSYADLTNKPTIPTVTNDLTDTLKSNYDTAYTHSQSAHAPSNAQKNSDITKAEIEAKLTGNITTHTHSQYLTEHQSLDGYVKTTDLSKVATTGNYNDLSNKPTIPSAYTHPSTHPASMITGLSKVATSGSYNDLSNKPTIPTIPDSLPANGGNADTVNNFRIWSGTQAQFDAIRTKDANTIYLIKEG